MAVRSLFRSWEAKPGVLRISWNRLSFACSCNRPRKNAFSSGCNLKDAVFSSPDGGLGRSGCQRLSRRSPALSANIDPIVPFRFRMPRLPNAAQYTLDGNRLRESPVVPPMMPSPECPLLSALIRSYSKVLKWSRTPFVSWSANCTSHGIKNIYRNLVWIVLVAGKSTSEMPSRNVANPSSSRASGDLANAKSSRAYWRASGSKSTQEI